MTRPFCTTVIVWLEISTRATRLALQPCVAAPNSIVANTSAVRITFFMCLTPDRS